jgi:seryl-tRNA synthetase
LITYLFSRNDKRFYYYLNLGAFLKQALIKW